MQLTKYTEMYADQLRRWLQPIFVEKRPEPTSQRCCFYMCGKTINLVHTNQTANGIELLAYECLHYDEFESVPLLLTGVIARMSLAAVPIQWLLAPDEYQLFLIESLPVSEEEFAKALLWRARSLVSFPIEEAVVDSFKLPPKRAAVDNMIAAVIAKRPALAMMIDTLKRAGLTVSSINIPELAMRNLSAFYEDDEKSTAFIYFFNHFAILNITRQKTLYFTRRINLVAKEGKETFDDEQLCLDLLRYYDYYQSQWRHPSPSRIFIAGNELNLTELAKRLSEYMLLTVEPYQIKGIKGQTNALHLLEKSGLLALGCIAHEDNVDVKTRN